MEAEKINIDDKQFGKKIGKHACDFGLDPSNLIDRGKMKEIINEIAEKPNEIRRGSWPGQESAVDFRIKGEDVVIVNNGDFISVLKNGIKNKKIINAELVNNND